MTLTRIVESSKPSGTTKLVLLAVDGLVATLQDDVFKDPRTGLHFRLPYQLERLPDRAARIIWVGEPEEYVGPIWHKNG